MSISRELGDSVERFKTYTDRLIALLRRHEIGSVSELIDAYRHNDAFSDDWKAIWRDIAEADGGKVSLTTAGPLSALSLAAWVSRPWAARSACR